VCYCAEAGICISGRIEVAASVVRIPVHGSGLTGRMKRLAPAVDAPKGTPLKTYTPFRLNPRIFPAVVSATVAASEAMTVLYPQTLAVDFVFS
jgi:hypothetical protein